MFTQFRQAVENLAPPPRRSSDASADTHNESGSRPNSIDFHARPSSPLSSSQLAESALINLRKSLATQRASSPASAQKGPGGSNRPPKSTLEDRLRAAAFAIGDASNTASPDMSTRSSPSPMVAATIHPLSPLSTPLPDSPALSPKTASHLTLAPTTSITTPPDPPQQDARSPPLVQSSAENSEIPPTTTTEPTHPETDVSIVPLHTDSTEATNVDELQARLKQVEQRFTDVSTSFKRLQAEKLAADLVLRELTPLGSVQDSSSLRDYLQNMISKAGIFQDEIKFLNAKFQEQEGRIQELRDTHRLESASQSDQVETLRVQLSEAEALLKASQSTDTQAEEEAAKKNLEIDRLQAEVDRAKSLAKEEEEKRVKAISLLKSVRQKLVKAEKDKDDALKEIASLKERGKSEREREQVERGMLQHEIEVVNMERERAVAGLRAQFDKEVGNIKERHEKDVLAQKERFELEWITLKSTHSDELATKTSRISSLENSLNNVTRDKNTFFDHLQLRQAELESAQSHLESLQSQNTELQYQLREAHDRYALLKEDFAETQREQESQAREPAASTGEMARLLSETEAKYESKISDLKRSIRAIEKERNDGELEWSRKLRDKTRETEELKRVVGSVTRTRESGEETVAELKAEIGRLEDESRLLQKQFSDLLLSNSKVKEDEKSGKAQELELNTKVSVLERQVEEFKSRETQLRLSNKTLREELRKVQSSAALLERQRNPGVGYWTSRTVDHSPTDNRTSISSNSSDPPSRTNSPAPTPSRATNDEEVNLEYLRNVILQFLEHKEMRPNLVKVLSIILRFTPQETRRLVAKV